MPLLWQGGGILLDLFLRISNLPPLLSGERLGIDRKQCYLDLPGLRVP